MRQGTPPPFWYSPRTVWPDLWRDHHDVNRLLWLDEAEMDVEAMGEGDSSAITKIVVNKKFLVDVGLQLVRRCHHHEVGPLGGIGNIHH